MTTTYKDILSEQKDMLEGFINGSVSPEKIGDLVAFINLCGFYEGTGYKLFSDQYLLEEAIKYANMDDKCKSVKEYLLNNGLMNY